MIGGILVAAGSVNSIRHGVLAIPTPLTSTENPSDSIAFCMEFVPVGGAL